MRGVDQETTAVRLLGPLEAVAGGQPVALGGTRPRSVLALLAAEVGRVIPAQRLAETIWGEDAAESAVKTLQVHVSNLRRSLAPVSEALGVPDVVVTRAPGYVLEVPAHLIDAHRFDELVDEARACAVRAPGAATAILRDALSLWAGEPCADLRDEPFWEPFAERFRRRRQEATLLRFELELDAGRHAEVLVDLTAAAERDRYDERLHALLMIALYRSGRQADALAAYRRVREALGDDLGLDPSADLRELETKILTQDPELDPPDPASSRPPAISSATLVRSSVLATRAWLVVGDEEVMIATGVMSIGRRNDCDFVIDDERVSRRHAEIRMVPGGIRIVDLGSTNGTQVNGVVVDAVDLGDGDEIVVGRTAMRVRIA